MRFGKTRILAIAFLLLPPAVLRGQTPVLTISAATLSVNLQATDSYTLSGTFSGLSLSGVRNVGMAIGPFAGTVPMSSFVQQPGTNVFVYQDSTGQTPYWLSSLTFDLDAQTFSAQASGIVLAGLPNPFAVYFGSDQGTGCVMARVEQVDTGSYQLNAGDGVGEPCQIQSAPVAEPPVFLAGTPTPVTITMPLLPTTGLDPQSVQLFRADGNAQPTGSPLCTLSDNHDGTYSCSVSFNETTLGTIPLIVQAAAGAQTILSPGFWLNVVGPMTDDDRQQFAAVQNAIVQAGQNFTQYGDSAQARIVTMQALRALLPPQPGLTGQPVGLTPDGLSIGVRCDSGLEVIFLLDDAVSGTSDVAGVQGQRLPPRKTAFAPAPRSAMPEVFTTAAQPTQCGDFPRDIVKNSKVMLWDPGSVFFQSLDSTVTTWDPGPAIVQPLQTSNCPHFDIQSYNGSAANVASLNDFPDYGTIVMVTHGGVDRRHRFFFVTGQQVSTGPDFPAAPATTGTSCFHVGWPVPTPDTRAIGCYIHVYASHPSIRPLSNTVILANFCTSVNSATPLFKGQKLPQLFRSPFPLAFAGPQSAYYGFDSAAYTDDQARLGTSLFNSLVYTSSNAAEAFTTAAPFQGKSFFERYGDDNLAYLGNPTMLSGPVPFPGMPEESSLFATLAGSLSCDPGQGHAFSCLWSNTVRGGTLTPWTGTGMNFFTNKGDSGLVNDANRYCAAVYTPTFLGLPDDITVTFLPNGNAAAAKACKTLSVSPQTLHVTFDGKGQSSETVGTTGNLQSQKTANLTWHASWDLQIPNILQGLASEVSGNLVAYYVPALPGTTVTGTTTTSFPQSGNKCQGPPVINTDHGHGPAPTPQSPFIGIGAQPQSGTSPYPIVPMFVETFGGDDYRLCDGGSVAAVADYGTAGNGYPGWDLASNLFKFNLDLSQYLGKTATMTMPVAGHLQAPAGDFDSGTVDYSGTLTFSTTVPCNPATQTCVASSAPSLR